MLILIILVFTIIGLLSIDDAKYEEERRKEYEQYENICSGNTTKTTKSK